MCSRIRKEEGNEEHDESVPRPESTVPEGFDTGNFVSWSAKVSSSSKGEEKDWNFVLQKQQKPEEKLEIRRTKDAVNGQNEERTEVTK